MAHEHNLPATGDFAKHLPALDGIRGAAILWVVLHNSMDLLDTPGTGPFHLLALVTHPGWIGVQIFFTLSGFLITGGLLDSQRTDSYYGTFYMKRALRILPLYYAVLLSLLVALPLMTPPPVALQPAVQNQLWLWLFITNWTHGSDHSVFGFSHFWSLAVEEQFYLFWPLLVHRLSPRRLFRVCLAIALASMCLRSAMALAGAHTDVIYNSTICRMDALSLGAAGAAVLRDPQLKAASIRYLRPICLGAVLLFLVGVIPTHAYSVANLACQTYGYSMLALASAVLVLGTASVDATRRTWATSVFRNAILRSLGKYSYAMYVLHGLLHKFIGEPWLKSAYGPAIPSRVVGMYGVAIVMVSYVCALLTYHAFEKHFLKLKNRLTSCTPITDQTASMET